MRWLMIFCGVVCPLAFVPRAAADSALPTQIRCESHGMEPQHCPIDTRDGVQLVHQLSASACIRGSQWDLEPDGGGIWVALGCRGEFRSMRPLGDVPTRRVLRCKSSGRQESCPVMLRGAPVRLLRQLSTWPCKQDRSWGVRRNEIWVSRGCEGEFEIGAEDGSGFVDAPRGVICESKRRSRRQCGTSVERGVRLGRQLSGTACVQGENWGWNRDGIWVDDGCRAEFIVE